MFARILVPLDGSAFSEAALPYAIGLARKTRGQVRLLSVHDEGWSLVDGEWGGALRARARYLDEQRDRAGHFVSDVTTAGREGAVAEQILSEADDFGADLIVMATHGRGPVGRFWLGSVAHRCVRTAHRCLLLVRPSATTRPRPVGSKSRAWWCPWTARSWPRRPCIPRSASASCSAPRSRWCAPSRIAARSRPSSSPKARPRYRRCSRRISTRPAAIWTGSQLASRPGSGRKDPRRGHGPDRARHPRGGGRRSDRDGDARAQGTGSRRPRQHYRRRRRSATGAVLVVPPEDRPAAGSVRDRGQDVRADRAS